MELRYFFRKYRVYTVLPLDLPMVPALVLCATIETKAVFLVWPLSPRAYIYCPLWKYLTKVYLFLPPANEGWGKVLFLRQSVSHSVQMGVLWRGRFPWRGGAVKGGFHGGGFCESEVPWRGCHEWEMSWRNHPPLCGQQVGRTHPTSWCEINQDFISVAKYTRNTINFISRNYFNG